MQTGAARATSREQVWGQPQSGGHFSSLSDRFGFLHGARVILAANLSHCRICSQDGAPGDDELEASSPFQ